MTHATKASREIAPKSDARSTEISIFSVHGEDEKLSKQTKFSRTVAEEFSVGAEFFLVKSSKWKIIFQWENEGAFVDCTLK